MAPAVAAWIASLRESGQVTIVGGTLQSVEPVDGGLMVTARTRESGEIATFRVDAAINCTALPVCGGTGSAPIDDRVVDELIRPEPLGLGLDTGETGRCAKPMVSLGHAVHPRLVKVRDIAASFEPRGIPGRARS